MSVAIEQGLGARAGIARARALRLVAIVLGVIALVILPFFLDQRGINYAIKLLIAALYAMGFNVLWSQARLLSFGHAAPFGVGAFSVLHLMKVLETSQFTIPTPLVPAVGMLGGLVVGVLLGYFATVRTGTYFSMITLAMTELMSTLARRWDSVFGGETGLSSMRMPWAGLSFGDFNQVYYVVLAWCLIGVALLRYLTLTPFGRISMAVGNNERRLEFLGFDTRALKTNIVAVSSAVAGLAGGLLTFTTENASYEMFSGSMSAQPIFHSFIGGVGVFLGPALGAAVLTLFGLVLSDVTRIWLLYQGVLFILIVILLPIGLGGAIAALCSGMAPWAVLRTPLVLAGAGSVLFGSALTLLGEISYRFFQPAIPGEILMEWLNVRIDPASPAPWLAGVVVAAAGLALLIKASRSIREAWSRAR
jgi:branched-chain amino acid transport system permease protein